MFIQTENTPNPNAMKFLPAVAVSPEKPMHFDNITEATKVSALAGKLFGVHGIEAVFFGSDFITITKSSAVEWQLVKPEILMIIMDHFVAGLPVFNDSTSLQQTTLDLTDKSELEKQIIEIIETRVRPSVAMDGGDITYVSFENGVVKLQLKGSCSGCPSSTITLKNGIESMLKHFVPEVQSVEAANEE